MASLRERLLKNTSIKNTNYLSESKFFNKKDMITTSVPMINVALSGEVDGGLTPGLTMLAGPSKHFKTAFSLLLASAYLKRYKDDDVAILFYDSEFGTPQSYFSTFDIPLESVVHTPISDVEMLKQDIMKQLNALEENSKLIIIIDSIGNLASAKEVQDALDGKSVADMTRAKAIKSLFRMVTPILTMKNIPMVVVNHTYKEMSLFPKDIVSGGTGSYYSSDNIWIIGRQQDKEDKEVMGYHFIINIEKSRYVKEKSKIPITVRFDGGIQRFSGLLDLAVEFGIITKEGRSFVFDGNKYKEDETNNSAFWSNVFKTSDFKTRIRDKYKLITASHDLSDAVPSNEETESAENVTVKTKKARK